MTRLRRLLTAASAAAALWALAITATGGIVLDVAGVGITSRNPRNPLLAAVVFALVAVALPMPDRRQVMAGTLRAWADWLRHLARTLWWVEAASVAAAAAIFFELRVWAFARPFWLDEQLIAINIRDRPFAGLGGSLWLGQSAPYGWMAIERTVLLALGPDERLLRLLPVLFGCATVLLALWAGRRWMGRTGALVLVVLCGFGQWMSHYPLELKHYSADAFFGLLLPVLAMWALERRDLELRRVRRWWLAAAGGLWLSYGAMLAAPACALVLTAATWARHGLTRVVRLSAPAVLWLASFGLHYAVSLRHSAASAYLHDYWASAFPPATAGAVDTLRWSWERLAPLALIPGGTALGSMLWLAMPAGLLWMAGRRRLPGSSRPRQHDLPPSAAVLLALIPISAFALSIARLVPMQDRLALWIVPALYLGLAWLAQAAADLLHRAVSGIRAREPGWPAAALSIAGALAAGGVSAVLSADIVSRGWVEIRAGRVAGSNHGLDDRSAVRWLFDRQQPGDVLVSTHLGVPAFWWYGSIPIARATEGTTLADGTPVMEARRVGSAVECSQDGLSTRLRGYRRVLLYSGFPDEPVGFDEAVIGELIAFGRVIDQQRFGRASRALIIAVDSPAGTAAAPTVSETAPASDTGRSNCIIVRPARRW